MDDSATARQLKHLARRSDTAGLIQLGRHILLLALTTTLVALTAGSPWLAISLPLHGVVLIFLFAPLHESIHATAFRSRWLNGAVAHACGFVLLLPPAYFRAFHLTHHRCTQDPGRDPELAGGGRPRTLASLLWHISGFPYWGERIATTVKHAFGRVGEPFIAPREKGAVIRETRGFLAAYCMLVAGAFLAGSAAPLLYWAVPVVLGQPFLRLYLLAEHDRCPLVPDMLRNTRTTLTNGLVRCLAWNMPYHVEHHVSPGIPFHALPRAHEVLRGRTAHLDRGYVNVMRESFAARGAGSAGAPPSPSHPPSPRLRRAGPSLSRIAGEGAERQRGG